MPESSPTPTPEQLWQWMLSYNIRINVFPQSRSMTWDTTERDALGNARTTTETITTEGGMFYCSVRRRESGPVIFKAHSFATPGEAYDAAWAGLRRHILTVPHEWNTEQEAVDLAEAERINRYRSDLENWRAGQAGLWAEGGYTPGALYPTVTTSQARAGTSARGFAYNEVQIDELSSAAGHMTAWERLLSDPEPAFDQTLARRIRSMGGPRQEGGS